MSKLYYALAAQTGRENDVEEALRDFGVWTWVAREVRPVTPKGCKDPVASERPMWPGYVFALMDASDFFGSRNIRYLHSTKLQLNDLEAGQLLRSRKAISAEGDRVRRQIEAGTKKVEFQQGQALEIIGGMLAGRLASFSRVIQRSGVRGFRLQINVDGMGLPVQIDPADIREVG